MIQQLDNRLGERRMGQISDYEDVTVYGLDLARELELRKLQNECTFIWSNKLGEPVGVIMSYLDTDDGKLWLTGTEQRVRFAAIARDPRTCICISSSRKYDRHTLRSWCGRRVSDKRVFRQT